VASAWGVSFGSAWGNSWGAISTIEGGIAYPVISLFSVGAVTIDSAINNNVLSNESLIDNTTGVLSLMTGNVSINSAISTSYGTISVINDNAMSLSGVISAGAESIESELSDIEPVISLQDSVGKSVVSVINSAGQTVSIEL